MTPAPEEDPSEAEGGAARRSERVGPRVNRNLVALATAGVVAVYAAGYLRTESAAESFEEAGAGRRAGDATPAARPPSVASPEGSGSADPGSPPQSGRAGSGGSGQSSVASPPLTSNSAGATPPATSVPNAGAAGEPAAAGAARFKDGLYTGWGRSLHGNIEATVEIREGRILSAKISTCKTRWPCARIAYLVPQVAERQSQEVDVITGATHSSDAFYYAVAAALSKAR